LPVATAAFKSIASEPGFPPDAKIISASEYEIEILRQFRPPARLRIPRGFVWPQISQEEAAKTPSEFEYRRVGIPVDQNATMADKEEIAKSYGIEPGTSAWKKLMFENIIVRFRYLTPSPDSPVDQKPTTERQELTPEAHREVIDVANTRWRFGVRTGLKELWERAKRYEREETVISGDDE